MSQTGTKNKAPAYRFVIWIVLTACYISVNMGMQVVATYGQDIIEELGITNSTLSLISNGTTFMLALFALIGGPVAAKLGSARKTLLTGLIIIGIAGLGFLTNPRNVVFLILLRLLQGVGSGLVLVFSMGVAPWFPRNERGIATGLETGMFGVSITAITLICSFLSGLGFNWARGIGVFLIAVAIICSLLVGFFYKDIEEKLGVSSVDEFENVPAEANTSAADKQEGISGKNGSPEKEISKGSSAQKLPGSYSEMLRAGIFWVLVPSFFAYIYVLYDLGFILPGLIPELGFDAATTTAITSITFLGTILASPLGGILSDKVFKGKRWQTNTISFACALVFMLIFYATANANASVPVLTFLCFLAYASIPLCAAPLWVLPAEIFEPEFFAKGMGVLMCIANVAGVIGIAIAGAITDATGTWMYGYLLTAVVAAVGCVFSVILGIKYKK